MRRVRDHQGARSGDGACPPGSPWAARAADHPPKLNGLRDERYVRESIVAPNTKVAGGESSLMPEDYARRLSRKELDDLVAFIARPAR